VLNGDEPEIVRVTGIPLLLARWFALEGCVPGGDALAIDRPHQRPVRRRHSPDFDTPHRPPSWLRQREELAEECVDEIPDRIADGPDLLEGFAGRVLELPVLIALPW
jgi:hypothetical protein